jgi:hypothetical protein
MITRILYALMLVPLLAVATARADIVVTNMTFGGGNYPMTGSLLDAGGGYVETDPYDSFFGNVFFVTQQTLFMDNTGSWSGTFPYLGGLSYNYDDEIAAMSSDQVAVGVFHAWKGLDLHGGVSLLIFECGNSICTGVDSIIETGEFAGQSIRMDGTGSAAVVPVPPALWLFGSGLLGLLGLSGRRATARQ